jgi:hypothetical protein
MSGGGRGRNNGQSSGRGSQGRGNNIHKPSKKTLADSIYYLGSAKQAADYETTTDFLINHINKTFNFGNNIETALEQLEEYNMDQHHPTLHASNNIDPDHQDVEDKQFEIEFKAEFNAFIKQKQNYKTNVTKAYAFLWEKCAKAMQSKVESGSKFESNIKGNPIKLLKIIKQYALSYHKHPYKMAITFGSLQIMIS